LSGILILVKSKEFNENLLFYAKNRLSLILEKINTRTFWLAQIYLRSLETAAPQSAPFLVHAIHNKISCSSILSTISLYVPSQTITYCSLSEALHHAKTSLSAPVVTAAKAVSKH
jgi:hypothetical protein